MTEDLIDQAERHSRRATDQMIYIRGLVYAIPLEDASGRPDEWKFMARHAQDVIDECRKIIEIAEIGRTQSDQG